MTAVLLDQLRNTARNLAASPHPNAHRLLAAVPQMRMTWWGLTPIDRRTVLLLISWAARSVEVVQDGTEESLFADALTSAARAWTTSHPESSAEEFCESTHEAMLLAHLLAFGPDLEVSHQLSLAMTALIPFDE
ncbi:hypothetical protein ACFXEL_24820 [Streptomyces sp. NPDC059382]|uniref:hypothetical protein n=1 Tax=Streptomyces sp. NPDC059382 TaxID=3346816 RepID=UPI00368A4670